MRNTNYVSLAVVLVSVVGCGEERDLSSLRAAVADAHVKIGDMVLVAEASMTEGRAVTAELRVDSPVVYAYGTIGSDTLHDVRIDTQDGHIISNIAAGATATSCPGSITLAAAIAVAEARIANGTVIAAIPDDDVACAREIQVLTPDLLWEVKVAGSGEVLEAEESDETED